MQWKKPDWANLKARKSRKKVWILSGICLTLATAIVLGIFLLGANQEPVGVYPFIMVGMDGYWGDSQESYGPVSTDKIQTVYLSDTQTITEVLVAFGDPVKKGDVLMTFDTTLSALQLERKRLDVEKLKLELDVANAELKTIKGLKPMEPMPDIILPDTSVNLGETLTGNYKTYIIAGHDGKTMETAFVCWIKEDGKIEDALLEELRIAVWKDSGLCEHGNKLAECPTCNCTHTTENKECEVCTSERCIHDKIRELCPSCKTCIHGKAFSECSLCQSEQCRHGIPMGYCKLCCAHGIPLGECPVCYCEHGVLRTETCLQCNPPEPEPSTDIQGISANGKGYRIQLLANEETTSGSDCYYVIFKTTSGNTELGALVTWQGVQVEGKGKSFKTHYFTPSTIDYTVPEMEETPIVIPDYDPGSGMTAAQIAQLRSEQEQKIKELTLKHKMAEAEYKIMAKEMGDGHIYAEFDGEVVSVLTEEEAKDTKQPVLKVSGGGGFFIVGSVSELEKENLKVGQEVTVNDWNSGGSFTGTVRQIGDFPSIDGYWNGAGNPNTTYYPFTVFVGDEASLQAGNYANIQYSTGESASGIYLEKAFLRTEQGRSFVYLRGADGRLEKRFVTTGKTLWGNYVEIKSGLTVEDYIAFPYGKDVKSGAPTAEKDISDLYGY